MAVPAAELRFRTLFDTRIATGLVRGGGNEKPCSLPFRAAGRLM
jgi:hypothetical protein